MSNLIERRACGHKPTIEKRADGKEMIVGYGAVFYRADAPGTQFELWTNAFERIMPTAFDAALREKDDVRALINHDSNQLLGRLPAGTLRLAVDTVGLRYEIDPPDTSSARDLIESLRRGDMDGSSFSFLIYTGKRGRVTWSEEKLPDGSLLEIREIHDLELIDVGPVTFPAYTGTSAGMRSREQDLREELTKWRAERAAAAAPTADDVDFRAREVAALTGDW